jgi:hypothetical protein
MPNTLTDELWNAFHEEVKGDIDYIFDGEFSRDKITKKWNDIIAHKVASEVMKEVTKARKQGLKEMDDAWMKLSDFRFANPPARLRMEYLQQ